MSLVWLNGSLLSEADARIAPDDRGLLLADGVFETIRLQGAAPCHLPAHLKRLHIGAALLGIPIPHTDATLAAALSATAAANRLANGILRLTLTRGPGLRGLSPLSNPRPTVLIAAFPLPAPLPPARLVIATRTRRNAYSPLSRIKSLNYGDNLLARMEATDRGADEALLLNGDSLLACATIATVLVHKDGHWLTPPVSDGALPGIARARLLWAGLISEASISAILLSTLPPILLCNSLGLRETISLDGQALPTVEISALRALLVQT